MRLPLLLTFNRHQYVVYKLANSIGITQWWKQACITLDSLTPAYINHIIFAYNHYVRVLCTIPVKVSKIKSWQIATSFGKLFYTYIYFKSLRTTCFLWLLPFKIMTQSRSYHRALGVMEYRGHAQVVWACLGF